MYTLMSEPLWCFSEASEMQKAVTFEGHSVDGHSTSLGTEKNEPIHMKKKKKLQMDLFAIKLF